MVEWSARVTWGTNYPDPHPNNDTVRELWAARKNIYRRLSICSLEFDGRRMEELGESEPWTPREALAPLICYSQTPGEGNT